MTYIEGIGDEVIECLIVLVIIVFATLAWWSTSTSDRPLMRTVYIVALHGRSASENGQPVGLTEAQNGTQQSDATLLPPHSSSIKQEETVEPVAEVSLTDDSPDGASSQASGNSECLEVVGIMDEGIQNDSSTDDSPSNVLRQRRIAFFQNRGSTLLEPTSSSNIDNQNKEQTESREGTPQEVAADKYVEDQTEDNAKQDEPLNQSSSGNSERTTEQAPSESQTSHSGTQPISDDCIKIKLMYLNEEQKLVDGRRQELLGEFKRRHFSTELSANKVVKLIFNGRLLLKDAETLQNCGLYNNCVVHCLIHVNRSSQQSATSNNTSNTSSNNHSTRYTNQQNGQQSEWRLGSLLYSCLLIILSFCWYCQFSYSQLFTFTTTAALTVLTLLFLISLLPNNIPYLEYLHNNEVHIMH
nr:PREDICTED: transmembrane and ubiquitin-like domain-containing protein 1 [Bemisia tabaci]